MNATTVTMKDRLYGRLLDSPLGVCGAEQTLPALENLLREVRRPDFWKSEPQHQLPEEQIVRVWADYKQALSELRERLRQRPIWDELLSWLVMFLIDHYRELARTSAVYERSFQLALQTYGANMNPEDALAMRDDFQTWAVGWLRDALRDGDWPPGSGTADGGQRDGGDDVDVDLHANPKPRSDDGTNLDF